MVMLAALVFERTTCTRDEAGMDWMGMAKLPTAVEISKEP